MDALASVSLQRRVSSGRCSAGSYSIPPQPPTSRSTATRAPGQGLVRRVVAAAGTRGQGGRSVTDLLMGAVARQGHFGEREHAPFRAVKKGLTLTVAEKMEAQADDWIVDVGDSRHRVNVKLDASVPEPLPDLPVHLTHLEMAFKRSVVPAPDTDALTLELAFHLVDLVHPHPDVHVGDAQGLELEEHISALQRGFGVVVGERWTGRRTRSRASAVERSASCHRRRVVRAARRAAAGR